MFASSTKPNAPVADLSLFNRAKLELGIPVIGIGGVTLQNAVELIAAGADAIAVINAIFNADNIKSASRQFSSLF